MLMYSSYSMCTEFMNDRVQPAGRPGRTSRRRETGDGWKEVVGRPRRFTRLITKITSDIGWGCSKYTDGFGYAVLVRLVWKKDKKWDEFPFHISSLSYILSMGEG